MTIDLNDTNNTHSLGVLLTPAGGRVLDVGCGPGVVAQALAARGCVVSGIEVDKSAAVAAEAFCDRVVVGDVEALDLGEEFAEGEFDAVLLLDVLEHLRKPDDVVREIRPLLRTGGRVVASIPNITHAAVAAQLAEGRFDYTDQGLLDRTHLRFFDRAAVEALFTGAGFTIVDILRVTRDVDATEISVDAGRDVRTHPDWDTYQFVVVATPATPDATVAQDVSLAKALSERVRELELAVEDGAAHVADLTTQIANKDAELEARAAELDRLAELEGELRTRSRELEDLHGELRAVLADLAVKEEYVARLRETAEGRERQVGDLTAERDDLAQELARQRSRLSSRVADRLGRILRRIPGVGLLLRRRAARHSATGPAPQVAGSEEEGAT